MFHRTCSLLAPFLTIALITPALLQADDCTDASTLPFAPGLNLLGYTYNVFDDYAKPESAIAQVVTFGSETQTYCPDGVHCYSYPADPLCSDQQSQCFQSVDENSEVSYYGQTISQYTESLSVSASVSASYGLFSGSVKASYSEDVTSNQENQFYQTGDYLNSWIVKFDPQTLDSLPLTDTFQDDLDNCAVAAKDLFEKYGTHVVTAVVVGGSTTYSAYGSTSSECDESNFKLDVQASYESVSGSGDTDKNTSKCTEDVNTQTNLVTTGGDSTLMSETDSDTNQDNLLSWEASVWCEPEPVGFDDTYGLTPIWTWATGSCTDSDGNTAQRADQLYDSFHQLYDLTWENQVCETGDCTDFDCCSTPDPTEVVVGFGGSIGSDGQFECVGIATQSIQDVFDGTGEITWTMDGDSDCMAASACQADTCECWATVPAGTALTGLGLANISADMLGGIDTLFAVRLYYQMLTPADDTNAYLGGSVHYLDGSHSGSSCQTDFDKDDFQLRFKPADDNTQVITGIDAFFDPNSLELYLSTLYYEGGSPNEDPPFGIGSVEDDAAISPKR